MTDDWGALSRAARDAAYNNTAACPAGPAYMDALRAASADFRARHPEHLDLAYGPTQREAWDLFPNAPGSDCLVFIHGGYWQRNDRKGAAAAVAGAVASGWSAALPGYTLAPDASLLTIVGQIHAAFDWLAQHGRSHGITGRIVAAGWSARWARRAVSMSARSAGVRPPV